LPPTASVCIVTLMSASSPASLVDQLAVALPPGTTIEQTRRLVRDAVRRAHREGLPVTEQVLVGLASEACSHERHRHLGRGRRGQAPATSA
jgi:hypothetical protein